MSGHLCSKNNFLSQNPIPTNFFDIEVKSEEIHFFQSLYTCDIEKLPSTSQIETICLPCNDANQILCRVVDFYKNFLDTQ